jgi:branched-chain amino acid transport system ATP-binding protein
MSTITHLKEQGIAVLLVEQHAELALEVSDRVYVMDRGRIVHEGEAHALLQDRDKRKDLIGI